jgi:hypothetical protein
MSKIELHDLAEYTICTGIVPISPIATVAYIPIPKAGFIRRISAAINIETDGDTAITFELAGSELTLGGATQTMTILNASLVGHVNVVEFDRNAPVNFAREGEDADLGLAVGVGSVLAIVSDGNTTTGALVMMITIRP